MATVKVSRCMSPNSKSAVTSHTPGRSDLTSIRKRETETEKENRLLREQLAQERSEREVERRLFKELRSAA